MLTRYALVASACFSLFAVANPATGETQKDIVYYRSVEGEAACRQSFQLAYETLRPVLDQKGDKAIVLDVDETVLDNSIYQVETNGAFNETSWDAWVKRRQATTVPGADEFLNKVRQLPGVHIVYITDRTAAQEAATVDNMKALGLFKDGDVMLGKKDKPDTKLVRRQCVENGEARCRDQGLVAMPIAAQIGDSARDFEDYYGDSMRTQGRAAILNQIGKKYWIIPNPMYGQWRNNYK